MTERSEVSLQEVKTFLVLEASPTRWLTNAEITTQLTKVSPRSVRAYTLKFVKLGLLDQAELFPAHKYRIAATAGKRNRAYLQRLKAAADVFGLGEAK